MFIETYDGAQEVRLPARPIIFQDIIIRDTVQLWVQIMPDGSFKQTRLVTNAAFKVY